ncbi:unnamed protein product [Lathyrus oleraceus]|nr:protein ECERIFERUM 2-like [Pisum sativum]
MSDSKVTLDSKLTVVSSRPVKRGMIHKLSGVDHGMGYHTLHLIFYYKNEDNWFESFELDPLRESLSKVLSMYPTVTGRLARVEEDGGDWEIRCNDTGVRVIKANVDSTIEKWLSSSAGGPDEAQLIAWDDMPLDTSTWSPFQIQINSFKEGGIAIGVSCTHMIADLTFLSSFFKSWSQIYRHVTPISHPPFLTPISITSSPNNNEDMSPNSEPKPQTNITSATFKFSNSIIKQLTSKCAGATAFDVLAALFWTRVTLLKGSNLHKQNHSLSICRDFRKLIKTNLPVGYFGNALHFSKFSLNSEEMKNGKKLEDIASLIHMHMTEVTEEEIMSSIESFESQKESTPKCVYGSSELTCMYMEETESLLYESMFGDNEKPAHVSCRVGNVGGEGLIMVMPSSEGGFARNVIVMLKEEQVDKLCKDQEMLMLQPTIILC